MEAVIQPLIVKLALPYGLMLLVPGPNIFVVLRVNMTPSWGRCLSTASGIAAGAVAAMTIAAFSTAGLISLSGIERFGPIILATILINSAIKLFRSAGRNETKRLEAGEAMNTRVFSLGLATALSNPLTIPFFASFYMATPEACTPFGISMAAFTISLMALIWFVVVGRLASHPVIRSGGAGRAAALKYALACIMVIYALLVLRRLF